MANDFTCTFCHHVHPGNPRTIGHASRLACSPCHAGLLDLSICWICGELVYRGDECVSFGWVFWHRACYGCLLCGCKMLYQGAKIKDLYRDSQSDGAIEVEETPLCANCVVEMEIDESGEDEVLRKGLRRIEKADGGVTRQRYESKSTERAAERGGDGANSDGSNTKHSTGIGASDTIWVNIFDPMNGPTFQPSSLKPIPGFMQRPKWVNDNAPRQASSRTSGLRIPLPPRTFLDSSSDSGPSTIGPPGSKTPMLLRSSSQSPSKIDNPHPEVSISGVKNIEGPEYFSSLEPLKPLAFRLKPTYINEEPLQRPSSRLAAPRRRSETHASAYMTPPESSVEHLYERPEAASAPKVLTSRKPSTPAASQIALQLHRLMKASKPAQSTESVNSSRKSGSPSITISRATTEAKTDTSGSTASLTSTAKTRSKEGSVRRGFGAELRRFFTGK